MVQVHHNKECRRFQGETALLDSPVWQAFSCSRGFTLNIKEYQILPTAHAWHALPAQAVENKDYVVGRPGQQMDIKGKTTNCWLFDF